MRREFVRGNSFKSFNLGIALLVAATLGVPPSLAAQQSARTKGSTAPSAGSYRGVTTQAYNQKIDQLLRQRGNVALDSTGDYRIGPGDLLEISVLEAPDLDRTVRVSADGEISLPLIGTVQAAGLTSRGLQAVLANLLQHSYMKNPQVSVFVKEMRSHPVSVFGAVEQPGVYQIREPRTLIEVLSMAHGLAVDAGDTVIVMRHAGDPVSPAAAPAAGSGAAATSQAPLMPASQKSDPASPPDQLASGPSSVKISLKRLLDSGSARYNVLVYPGDVVKVTRAGVVYVVGDVRRPGGFLLKTNENISVLQALALAEGLTPTAEGKHARLILPAGASGSRTQVMINLNKILDGKAPDRMLQANDILFVPNSSRKSVLHGFAQSTGGILMAVAGASVYRW
jgi:polysaccharide export outer membrane protein